jgi:hypothetical protein
VELTERISSTKLSWWKARLPGERSRAALIAVADKSAFLALPAAEVPATAPPDPAARRQMISRTIDYLSKTVVKLPDFFAMRTMVQYDEPPQKDEQAWVSLFLDIGWTAQLISPLNPLPGRAAVCGAPNSAGNRSRCRLAASGRAPALKARRRGQSLYTGLALNAA